MINRVRQHKTKKGELMAFVNVSDEAAALDIAVMPRQYARYQQILEKGTAIYFEAKKDRPDSCILQNCRKCEL
jgi:DNA polymerase-3 subunit alpha